jgi:FkbM family methyltransferase
MLTTKTKVTLAAFAYRTLSLGRRAIGKDNHALVRRGGFHWSLDLSEGIDFSIYLLGGFEKPTAATLRQLAKPGDIAFDIGANVGAHTLGLARSVGPAGRVFAFEPADSAFAKLRKNLSLNPELAARTIPSQVLLTDSASAHAPAEIYASWPLENTDGVHPKHRGRLVSTSRTSVDTLDHVVQRHGLDRVNLIKLDVDGHELPVLRGGFAVLTKLRPTLVMEMSPYIHAEQRNNFADLIELLSHTAYRITDASTGGPLRLDASTLERLIPDGASINVVAQPVEIPLARL